MKRRSLRTAVLLFALAAGLFLLFRGGESSRFPFADKEERSPADAVTDFFGFGWHYSREVWARQSRDWPAMTRARLLGFEHRPDHPFYSDLRELSFFELGRVYERVGLTARAKGLYIQALKDDPENLWLKQWVNDKLQELNGAQSGENSDP